MVVKKLSEDMYPSWNNYVSRATAGSFFHLVDWKTMLERSFGYQPHYMYVEDNGVIRGVLPLFLVKNIFLRKTLCSVPFGVYGGVVADSPEAEVLLIQDAVERARQVKAAHIEFRHQHHNACTFPAKDLYVIFQKEIFEDDEKNMSAIPRKQRRMIRQGIKFGLQSKVGGMEDLESFHHIYTTSLRNLGTPAFPVRWFRHLLEGFGEQCRILSVWYQERMVGAVMTFFFKEQVMPYYGGSLPEFWRNSVNDFMYWELMRYGAKGGYKVFDFGRSKKGTGSYEFKRHWGVEPVALPYQYYLPKGGELPNLSPTNPKFQLGIGAWKRLPLPVANFIGPKIIRFFP